MEIWEAIVLGAVQGLTEFLPISSSGHLVLMQHFLGLEQAQIFFDVMVHVGTLGAVIAAYRQSLIRLTAAAFRALGSAELYRHPIRTVAASDELRSIWLLFLGSIPTAAIGLLFQDSLEAAFSNPVLVACMLLVTGVLLQLPGRLGSLPSASGRIHAWQAPMIGTAQGLAIIPGISRSGSTISTGLMMGVSAPEAARFSFLLSIPAILGALALKLPDAAGTSPGTAVLVAGTLSAFGVGYLALLWLLSLLKRGRFAIFSYYCFAVGIAALVALKLGL